MKHSSLPRAMAANVWPLAILMGGIAAIEAQAAIHVSATGPNRTLAQGYAVLKPGSTGAEVEEIQSMLTLMGYYRGPINGSYDAATANAVSQFQTTVGLSGDGIVGTLTWQRLLPTVATLTTPPEEATEPEAPNAKPPEAETLSEIPSGNGEIAIDIGNELPTLKVDDSGPLVERLQTRLTDLRLYSGSIDGVFGSQTEQAVQTFQRQSELEADGIVGPATWRRLLNQ